MELLQLLVGISMNRKTEKEYWGLLVWENFATNTQPYFNNRSDSELNDFNSCVYSHQF